MTIPPPLVFSNQAAATTGTCDTCGWDQAPLDTDGHIAPHNQRLVNRDQHGRPYTYSSPTACPGAGTQPARDHDQ